MINLIHGRSRRLWRPVVFSFFSSFILVFTARSSHGEDANLEQEVHALQQQNALLQQQLEKQNQSIETLSKKVQELETASSEHENTGTQNAPPEAPSGYNFGKVNLSGEGGVGLFKTGPQGFSPDANFRIDEARLFLEAPIWKEVYFQGEVDLATRENDNLNVQLGELYLDAQDISDLWGRDGQLNLRAGRMYYPFGEEYLRRYTIDDPLISHSIPDIWGYGTGLEAYGDLGKFNYTVAVQEASGVNGVTDFNSNEQVTGRIGYKPNKHWDFSVSATRTGNLSAQNDVVSSLWFGNTLFESLGGPGTTTFNVGMVEGDVTTRWSQWSGGYIHAFGGAGRYDDNDPAANNARDFFYYAVEGVQNLPKKFYVATQFSQAFSDKGMPIVGFGSYDNFGFPTLTTDLWRWSLGLGYRFSDQLLIKTEYAFEGGQDIGGQARNQENFFGTEAAFKF
ncbi:MAG TPA: hypothetical protein VMH87_11515 [Pseudomonadales bacterium]|nr:hypothetical protein [Pseudomonadales bacterium]